MEGVVSSGQNWVLTIPKNLISDKEIQKIIDLLYFNNLVKSSEMTEQKAWQLSEDLRIDFEKTRPLNLRGLRLKPECGQKVGKLQKVSL